MKARTDAAASEQAQAAMAGLTTADNADSGVVGAEFTLSPSTVEAAAETELPAPGSATPASTGPPTTQEGPTGVSPALCGAI